MMLRQVLYQVSFGTVLEIARGFHLFLGFSFSIRVNLMYTILVDCPTSCDFTVSMCCLGGQRAY